RGLQRLARARGADVGPPRPDRTGAPRGIAAAHRRAATGPAGGRRSVRRGSRVSGRAEARAGTSNVSESGSGRGAPLLEALAARHSRERRLGERAIAAYLVAAGLVAVIGTATWFAHGAQFVLRARGLSGHYMTFAGQLLLELLLALGIAACDARPRWRIGAS